MMYNKMLWIYLNDEDDDEIYQNGDYDVQHDVMHMNKSVSIFFVLAYKTNFAYSHPVGWLWINYWFNITTVLEILCMLTYRYRKKIENKIKTFCLVWEITVFVDVKRCNTFLSLRHLRSVSFSMKIFFFNEKGKFSMWKRTNIRYLQQGKFCNILIVKFIVALLRWSLGEKYCCCFNTFRRLINLHR